MNSTRCTLLAGAIALAVGACGSPPSETAGDPDPRDFTPPEPPEKQPIRFATSAENLLNGRFTDTIDLYGGRSFLVDIEIPNSPGPQFVHLEVYFPNGRLYASEWRAFSASGDGTETLYHPGFDTDLRILNARPAGDALRGTISMALAGSVLARYHQSGTFTAIATLGVDGDTHIGATTFHIVDPTRTK